MVINGASLPESLLEALGMPSGAGFQIKLVRSGGCLQWNDGHAGIILEGQVGMQTEVLVGDGSNQ